MTTDVCDAALDAGARGVLAKGLPAPKLAAALEAVANGEIVVSDAFLRAQEPPWPGAEFGLTARESEVAALLSRGMTNREIASALWISENTVKTHLKAIFQKTMASSRSEAIVRITRDAGFARRIA
jgi:DNA-binding NarL/FixJ family response regulator